MQKVLKTQTQFLGLEDVCKIVGKTGLPQTLRLLVETIADDYRHWQDFDKCARVANHSKDGVIELMPISNRHTYAFKYVNGHPKNTAQGLPCVMAFGVLADVDSGIPVLLSEMTLSTALRTAAMSVVAAHALARPDSKTMALIGNGAQSEFQALAFHHLMGIEELRLFDVDPKATSKLIRNLRNTGLCIKVCPSVSDAVRGSDIVTTVTADNTNATILTPAMIEPGMHINGVGGDCPGKTELHPEVLHQAAVFVQFEPQTRVEGDIQRLPADFAVTELWQVLNGNAPGRTSAEQVTVFDSVGFALEDYSVLRFMLAQAREQGMAQSLSLIPALPDPKDLFALLRPNLTSAPLDTAIAPKCGSDELQELALAA